MVREPLKSVVGQKMETQTKPSLNEDLGLEN